MSIVGQAELDIRAVGDRFEGDINRVVKPGMSMAAVEAEKQAGRARKAWGSVFSGLSSQAGLTGGPISQLVSELSQLPALEKNLRGVALTGGAVATTAGLFGMQLGSGEKAAQGQLRASIEQTGSVYENHSKQIEGAVKAGERHGDTAEKTYGALNTLTIATGSADKALHNLNLVFEIAAARHISLESASHAVGLALNGNTRLLRGLGVNMADQQKLLTAATAATNKHETAQTALSKARQHLADVERELGARRHSGADSAAKLASAQARVQSATAAVQVTEEKHGAQSPQAEAARGRLAAAEANLTKVRADQNTTTGLTVAQQLRLRDAHDKVTEAQKNLTTTAQQQTTAQKAAKDASADAQTQLDRAAQRLAGQDTAQMHTFAGSVDHIKATVDDMASSFGNKWGGVLTGVGGAAMGISGLASAGKGIAGLFARTAAESQAALAAGGAEASAEMRAGATIAEAELAAGGARAGAAEAAGGAGAVASITSVLGKAGLLAGAGIGAYVGTTELLRHTPLGKTVAGDADSVANLFGVGPKQAAQHERDKLLSPQLEKMQGTGEYAGYVFGPKGYFTPDRQFHTWDQAPASMQGMAVRYGGSTASAAYTYAGGSAGSAEHAMLVALLAIQHNTGKTATHTGDTHKVLSDQHRTPAFSRSPEMATV